MESYLDRIISHKREELARQWRKVPLDALRIKIERAPAARPFAAALQRPGQVTLIAEVKRASPSRGVLLESFDALAIARSYAAAGVAAISVLTDVCFFQGSLKYLESIREQLDSDAAHGGPAAPLLLRKDFILERYQVYESRAYGADALLLIVAALTDQQLAELLALTHELGMQALVEVHEQAELQRALAAGATIIGINNRDLRSFQVDLATTERVAAQLPSDSQAVLVSESGIFTPADIQRLARCGVHAVLVGEALITAADIRVATEQLVNAVQS